VPDSSDKLNRVTKILFRPAYPRISSILLLAGMGCLSACSLEQAPQEDQVRVQIDPSALRSRFSRNLNVSLIPNSESYLLVNVEGPGIPSIAVPNLPCVPLGIGSSVLIPAPLQQTSRAAGSTELPIELMVPAGLDRRIKLYEVQIIASSVTSLPASGASATQYFSMNSSGVRATDLRFHAEAFLPDLFSEQTVYLDMLPAPALTFCQNPGLEPPVLFGGGLSLARYRPWQKEGANFYEPNRSGPIRLWAAPSGQDFFLRFSGELRREGGLQSTDFGQSLVFATQAASSTDVLTPPAFQSSPPTGSFGVDSSWFQAAYPVTAPDAAGTHPFRHTVGSITRSGVLEIFSGSPFPESTLAVGDTEYLNVFYVDVIPVSGPDVWIRPISRDAVFGWNESTVGSTVARMEIVDPVTVNSGPPGDCPREGLFSSTPTLLDSNGCRLFFAVWNSTADASFKLDLDAAVGSAPLGFRQAQLSIFKTIDDTPSSGDYILTTRPVETSSGGRTSFTLNYPPNSPWDDLDEVISFEISGPGFSISNEEGSADWNVYASGSQFGVVSPTGNPSCITRVSVLARGKILRGNVYRRDVFNLPPCATPDPPAGISAELILDSTAVSSAPVRISWTNGSTAGGAGLEYEIQRGLPLSGGSTTAYATIALCNPQYAASPCEVSGTNISFVDGTAQPGVLYSYRVRAKDTASNLYSAPSETSIRPIGPVIALQPGIAGDRQLGLNWNPVIGADNYEVHFKPVTSAEWGVVTPTGNSSIIIGGNQITPGISYSFRVKAKNSSNQAAFRLSPEVTGIAMDLPQVTDFCTVPGPTKKVLFKAATSTESSDNVVRGASSGELVLFRLGEIYTTIQFSCPSNGRCSEAVLPIQELPSGSNAITVRVLNAHGFLESALFPFVSVPTCPTSQ
jgi:hypothetical protein